jgi:hypothetical protein
MRLLYVDMEHTAYYGIGDSKFRKILEMILSNAARPSSFADGSGICGSTLRLAEQQGVAYAKTVAEAMNLKLDRTIQQTARNCAEQFSILSPGEKCQSKKALPSVVDCYFHHWMNLIRGDTATATSIPLGMSGRHCFRKQ